MSSTRYLCKECGQYFWEDDDQEDDDQEDDDQEDDDQEDDDQEDDDQEGVCGPCGQRIFRERYFDKPQLRFFYVLMALLFLAEWYFFDLRNLKTGLAAFFGW